jgi:hypothetical protein
MAVLREAGCLTKAIDLSINEFFIWMDNKKFDEDNW